MPLASGITFPHVLSLELHKFQAIPDKECSLLRSLSYLSLVFCFVFHCGCDITVCFSESAAPLAPGYSSMNAYLFFFFFPFLLSGNHLATIHSCLEYHSGKDYQASSKDHFIKTSDKSNEGAGLGESILNDGDSGLRALPVF